MVNFSELAFTLAVMILFGLACVLKRGDAISDFVREGESSSISGGGSEVARGKGIGPTEGLAEPANNWVN